MSGTKKGKLFITLGIIAVAIILIIALFAGNYNSMVSYQSTVQEKQSAVQAQLQRRSELIPNLENAARGYAKHEESVYTSISDARSKLAGAKTVNELDEANTELSSAVSRLLAVVENYPELKSNQNFINLQDELAGTENRIAQARKDYNNAAKEYNVKIKRFPANVFAGIFGFESVDYFEADAGAERVPEVKF